MDDQPVTSSNSSSYSAVQKKPWPLHKVPSRNCAERTIVLWTFVLFWYLCVLRRFVFQTRHSMILLGPLLQWRAFSNHSVLLLPCRVFFFGIFKTPFTVFTFSTIASLCRLTVVVRRVFAHFSLMVLPIVDDPFRILRQTFETFSGACDDVTASTGVASFGLRFHRGLKCCGPM